MGMQVTRHNKYENDISYVKSLNDYTPIIIQPGGSRTHMHATYNMSSKYTNVKNILYKSCMFVWPVEDWFIKSFYCKYMFNSTLQNVCYTMIDVSLNNRIEVYLQKQFHLNEKCQGPSDQDHSLELNKRKSSCGSAKDSLKLFQAQGGNNIKDLVYLENCAWIYV